MELENLRPRHLLKEEPRRPGAGFKSLDAGKRIGYARQIPARKIDIDQCTHRREHRGIFW
jgi:hypothetical protein